MIAVAALAIAVLIPIEIFMVISTIVIDGEHGFGLDPNGPSDLHSGHCMPSKAVRCWSWPASSISCLVMERARSRAASKSQLFRIGTDAGREGRGIASLSSKSVGLKFRFEVADGDSPPSGAIVVHAFWIVGEFNFIENLRKIKGLKERERGRFRAPVPVRPDRPVGFEFAAPRSGRCRFGWPPWER